VRPKFLTLLLVAGLLFGSFAAGNYASGQTKKKKSKWQYTSLRHGPYLKDTGSDMKKIKALGAEGWELASSYGVKGEIVTSIFKREK
jgi:hypothetical protein